VCRTFKKGGYTEVSSIFLNRLSSAKLRSWDPKGLIFLGIIIAVLGLVTSYAAKDSGGAVGGVTMCLILVAIYFAVRRQFFEFIGFGGERIVHPTKSGFDACVELLHQIEAAQALADGKISDMPVNEAKAS
jgi:hypothetical protein